MRAFMNIPLEWIPHYVITVKKIFRANSHRLHVKAAVALAGNMSDTRKLRDVMSNEAHGVMVLFRAACFRLLGMHANVDWAVFCSACGKLHSRGTIDTIELCTTALRSAKRCIGVRDACLRLFAPSILRRLKWIKAVAAFVQSGLLREYVTECCCPASWPFLQILGLRSGGLELAAGVLRLTSGYLSQQDTSKSNIQTPETESRSILNPPSKYKH